MPDLKHPLVPRCELDHLASFSDSLGDRLFHQYARASIEEVPRFGEMSRGRCDDTYRIDIVVLLTVVLGPPRAHLGCNLLSGFLTQVGDGHELAPGGLRIFLRVKSAEIADTDDCCSDFFHENGIMPDRWPATPYPKDRTPLRALRIRWPSSGAC